MPKYEINIINFKEPKEKLKILTCNELEEIKKYENEKKM